jgi:hypothetical protein
MKDKRLPSDLLRPDEDILKIARAKGQLSRSEHDRLQQLKTEGVSVRALEGGQTGLRQQDRRRV